MIAWITSSPTPIVWPTCDRSISSMRFARPFGHGGLTFDRPESAPQERTRCRSWETPGITGKRGFSRDGVRLVKDARSPLTGWRA